MTDGMHTAGQHRRALSADDLHTIRQRITAAADTTGLLRDAVLAIYAGLLADTGRSLAELPAGQRLQPGDYAIPTTQWEAIVAAITHRAEAWGTGATLAVELVSVMPSSYDDPQVPAPDFGLRDYRPEIYNLRISCDAVDVIAACETHLQQLRAGFGATSAVYLDALHSWHRALAGLFSRHSGTDTTVSKDGPLSLLVRTAGGLVYAVIWHGTARRCTEADCDAVIDDDGSTRPGHSGGLVAEHRHRPSHPLGVAQPGQWSLHS